MTMLSRVLGLVRDVVLANILGATLLADVFLFAQKIPNFLRRLFAEGAFAQAGAVEEEGGHRLAVARPDGLAEDLGAGRGRAV